MTTEKTDVEILEGADGSTVMNIVTSNQSEPEAAPAGDDSSRVPFQFNPELIAVMRYCIANGPDIDSAITIVFNTKLDGALERGEHGVARTCRRVLSNSHVFAAVRDWLYANVVMDLMKHRQPATLTGDIIAIIQTKENFPILVDYVRAIT